MDIKNQNDTCLSEPLTEEKITIYETTTLLVEIIKSLGITSPKDFFYDQSEFEWVCLIEGEAILTIEGTAYHMKKGATLMIAPHQRHQVTYTSLDCVWLCLFLR